MAGWYASIDWVATGSWMQAWAGLAQAGAILIVAYKGFQSWKRQKIAERQLDLAERILDVTYRVKRAFAYVRSGMLDGAAMSEVVLEIWTGG